ncbi:ABC transporter permease (plasmid) [Azospirillum argentinense]|uniref:ABC transporter permease n=1 Tax=Azospirillum argentinense TaxID=2970906 RepID=A0A4D8PP82_9PROT|nr:ABC transporter permease subunit [Azospirillum argentinense]QCN99892.1 ABC transporter permease [Azospirillum argentinense]
MNTLLTIAAKEVRDGLRNRWVVATTLLMAALALTLSFLGAAPTGTVGVGRVEVTIVSLSSLTIFLLPLIALLLSFDAVVGEIDRGTMTLLLSYPVARWQVLIGKFLGHAAIIAFATVLGYGAAGVALAMSGSEIGPESWRAFAAMIGSSVLLGAAFTAMGYLASTVVRDRGTAAGIAVAIWLVLVLLYDMALLGLLVADGGKTVNAGLLNGLLLANPADAFRLFNLTGFKSVSQFAGTAGLAAQVQVSASVLLAVLAGWVAAPLALAAVLFSRRQI